MKIKLLKRGLRVDGDYYPCFYHSAKNNLKGNATIYLKTYKRLPAEAHKIFEIENNTDIQSDYFEEDRIRISPQNEFFEMVEKLAQNR